MKKSLKQSVYILLLLLIIVTPIKFLLFKKQNSTISNSTVTKSLHIETSQPIEEYQFILKEYNGKLAVFKKDSTEPEIIFDVLIDSLPEIDILQLKQGLKIKNHQELNERIEDFIS